MNPKEETFYHEVALGFAQLESRQTVTVESKEAFIALLRQPTEQPLPPLSQSQDTKKGH
jgi:hypothetical protein